MTTKSDVEAAIREALKLTRNGKYSTNDLSPYIKILAFSSDVKANFSPKAKKREEFEVTYRKMQDLINRLPFSYPIRFEDHENGNLFAKILEYWEKLKELCF